MISPIIFDSHKTAASYAPSLSLSTLTHSRLASAAPPSQRQSGLASAHFHVIVPPSPPKPTPRLGTPVHSPLWTRPCGVFTLHSRATPPRNSSISGPCAAHARDRGHAVRRITCTPLSVSTSSDSPPTASAH
eukprot:2801697-Rhodomonas_salina.1